MDRLLSEVLSNFYVCIVSHHFIISLYYCWKILFVPPPSTSRLSPISWGGEANRKSGKQPCRIFLFSDGRQVYLHVPLSIILNLISRVCVSLSLWLCGNTRELISFAGSGCVPQDLITVRCPVCAGFKHPPAWLSVCQLGLWHALLLLPHPPQCLRLSGSPHHCFPCCFFFNGWMRRWQRLLKRYCFDMMAQRKCCFHQAVNAEHNVNWIYFDFWFFGLIKDTQICMLRCLKV